MSNKNKSFLSFLDDLVEEIKTESEMGDFYKKIDTSPLKAKKSARKNPSIIGYLNDLVENMDRNFGEISEPQKPDLEAQRRLKADLRTKHADKFKKSTSLGNEIDILAKESLEAIRSNDGKNGSIKAKTEEGDNQALMRLRDAEQKEKTDKIREKMAKDKNRKRLKDAIIMAEILGPPVSKRR
ncbi:hypothetical protein [Anaerococcus degeneri]|uniref:Uncharacterized protein n=1 Tax=Anaerococcus degeneri TaxID=361500 RepID=A0ABS7YW74_9FIRM|nr:hypothetical protein [Anaerococcus degeneri]MBP2015618.1 hypothetical protein [Anaerococcus degeneri]MCA2095979.1 hypothetical protein [Anaerococcus degeneri]